jgi:hypothetical protein
MTAPRRTRTLLTLVTIVACALIAAGCGKFFETSTGGGDNGGAAKSDTTAPITDEPFDAANKKKYGCKDIEDMGDQDRTHTDDPVDYPDNPPAGGNHNPVPLDWGIYDKPQPDERWVHNLEHGHIVISYKGLSSKDLKTLIGDVKEQPYHLVLLPRPAADQDGIWYVAWAHRLFCRHPSEAALQEMKDQFLDQGPELFMNDRSKTDSEG